MNHKITFWQKHLNWFIPFVSEFYPLNKFQLLQYEDLLDWDRINANMFIWWTKQMKDTFKDRLANAKPIEEVLLPGDDIPVTLFYPSYDQVYFREDIKLKSQEYYWKDIEFGVYNNLLENYDDALMELVSRFDCGFTLEA